MKPGGNMSSHLSGRRRRFGSAAIAALLTCGVLSAYLGTGAAGADSSSTATDASPSFGARTLLVGTYKGRPGQFQTIQAAVDAARPGDWILVAPGDYHEQADHQKPHTD